MIFRPSSIPHLASAVIRAVVRWWNRAEVIASPQLADKRLEVCERCPFFEEESRQCNVCTCFVDLLVELKGERCPKGFWD